MLAVETFTRPVGDHVTVRPVCPNCGRSMHLARITLGTAGLPDLGSFNCGECGVSVTEVDRRSARPRLPLCINPDARAGL
jgi:predicted RNA-binding Zn-ribbon protein involved in translation (DUF1610 family)